MKLKIFAAIVITAYFNLITGFTDAYNKLDYSLIRSCTADKVFAEEYNKKVGNIELVIEKGVSYDSYLVLTKSLENAPVYLKDNCPKITLTNDLEKLFGEKYRSGSFGTTSSKGPIYLEVVDPDDLELAVYHELTHSVDFAIKKNTKKYYYELYPETVSLNKKYINIARKLKKEGLTADNIAYYNFCNQLIGPDPDPDSFNCSMEFVARTVSNYFTNKEYMKKNTPDVAAFAEDCLANFEKFYNEKHADDTVKK